MPISYSDALLRHDRSRAFGDPRDFQTFANDMEQVHPGEGFGDAAKRDGWWTRASTRVDQYVFDPVAEYSTKPLGGAIGELFGHRDIGEAVGKGLFRSLVETAPLYLLGPEAGIPATAAALAATGGLMGAHTYADTGSAAASLISGVAGAVTPGFGKVFGNVAAKLAGGTRLTGTLGGRLFDEVIPEAAKDYAKVTTGRLVGSQFGMLIPSFAANLATQRLLNPDQSIDWEHFGVETAISQIPFTVFDIVKTATAPRTTAEAIRPMLDKPKEKIVDTIPSLGSAEEQAQMDAAFAQLANVVGDESATPQDKEAALAAVLHTSNDPKGVIGLKKVVPTTDEPVTITGLGRKQANGNWKVLVQDVQTAAKLGVEPGQTVFVNGAEPKATEDGKMSFAVTPKQINKNVQSPLKPEHFGFQEDTNQPKLPDQPVEWSGFSHDEVQTLKEHGVEMPPVDPMLDPVKNPQGTVAAIAEIQKRNAPLVPIAHAMEETTGKLTETQQKIEAVPTRAEEIPEIIKVPDSDNPFLPIKDSPWITPDIEAISSAVRTQNGKVFTGVEHHTALDKAVEAGEVVEPDHDASVEFGYVTKSGKFVTDEQHSQNVTNARLEYSIKQGSTPTQAVEKVRLQTQTPVADSLQQQRKVLKREADKVLREAGKFVSTTGDEFGPEKPQLKYGEPIRDENGKNFATKELAAATKEADPELTDYVVRDAGKGKGFYLAKPINREVSLEGTEGHSLEQILTEPLGRVDERPDVSLQDSVNTISEVLKRPDILDEFLDNNDIAQSIKEAQQVRQLLSDKIAGKDLPKEHLPLVSKVLKGTALWNQRLRNFTLASEMPHDPTLVREIGFDESVPEEQRLGRALDHFIAQKDTGVFGPLMEGVKKATDLSKVRLTNDFREGFYYDRNRGVINVPYLPNRENYGIWSNSLNHEIVHHATAEVMNRTDPAAVQFKATVQQALKTVEASPLIPKVVRNVMKEFGGMYEEYVQSADSRAFNEKWRAKVGSEHDEWLDVVYGLQNPGELVAQMFSSPKMVEVMRQTQMPKTIGQTVMQFFSNAWNRVFGGKVETNDAFGQVLSHFDNYLSGVRIRPTREGIVRAPQEMYNGRDYLRDALISEGVRPEGLASRMDTVEQVFKTGDLLHSVEGFEREGQNGLLPATAEVGKATPEIRDALTKLPADVGTATMNLLADDVPTHQELWNRMNEDTTLAKDLYVNIKKGLVPGKLPEGALEKIQYAQVKLNAMKKALDKQALAIERFNDLNNFTYDGIESTMASRLTSKRLPAPPDPTGVQDAALGLMGLAEIRQKTSEEELHGVNQIGPITRNLMLTQHVKKLFPSFAPVANHVREHVGRAIERITTLNLAYAWDYENKTFSKSVAKSNMRVAQNERLTTASSNIKRFANMKEAGGTEWNWNDPEVQKELSKFNGPDRDAIKLEFDSERARHSVWTEQTLPQALTQINRENTAKVIAAFNPGMLPDTARDLSQQVYDAVAMFSDPAQSVVAVQMMQDLGTKMPPQALKAALTHAQGSIADVNKHIEFMRSRPSYVSEQRYDAHHLVMVGPDGKQFRVSRKTKEELTDIQSREEGKGSKFVEYIPKSDANTPAGGVNGAVLDSMRELDVQSYNRVKVALEGVDPQVASTVLSETQRVAQYESSANAFKPVPGVTRRFVAGREYINMIENAHEFYVRGNNWLRHRLTDATTSLDMMHPEVAGNRTLKQFAEQHVQNSLTPDNPFFRKLVEATYFQRLAFSLGNSALEGVQNLTTGMQAVISETGSVGDAFRLWGGAVKQLMTTRLSNNWGDPDLQWAMDRAARLGARGMAHWNDIIDPDRDTVFTINQQRMSTPAKGFQALQYGARKWATQFQRYNDNIGIITGFRLGLEKGMTKEQAFDFAWDLKERGYYSGGKAQRPVGLWSIRTKPVPQMLSSLQTYTLGWFSQMATDWKVGFGGHAPGEFSPVQRQGAKKAFLYGLGSQAVLAGALGLPGVGQGMALLKQATGIDLKGQLRGTLAQLFGEDQENGGMLTNLAMRGSLAAVSPIDPSNRAAVSFPFVGIDPYKGFDLSSLMGAPGATVSDSVAGLLAAGRGDFVGFQKLLPSVLKPTMGLIQGEGDVRDRRGTLLQTLSPAEWFMTALGLPSSRIQSARDTAEAVKNLNDAAQQQHQRFVDQLAEKVRTGRLAEVQQDLVQHKRTNPEVDLQSLVRSIAGRVEAQTVPYDYRRDLNVAADLHGFGSRMPSTEVERLKLRQNVEQNLGLYSRPNFREQQRASDIDALLNSDPYQSKGRAVRQLEELKRVRSRTNELYFPASQ